MSTCSLAYQPLTGTQIRLVRLKPRQPGDGLELDLIHVELDSKPHFYALSYVWGDAAVRKSAQVNGMAFDMTRSLYVALTYLQDTLYANESDLFEYEKDLLWIDALCINQSDMAEKSQQVPRMGEIYTSAHKVLAWLGKATTKKEHEKATTVLIDSVFWLPYMDEMETLGGYSAADLLANDDLEEDELNVLLRLVDATNNGSVDRFMEHHPFPMIEILLKILRNPWFSRIWIVQEAVLASEVIVLFDGHTTELCQLLNAAATLAETMRAYAQSAFSNDAAEALMLRNLLSTCESHNPLPLAHQLGDLLHQTTHRTASLPHDYLYGLLGLLTHPGDLPTTLTPNYSTPFAAVFHAYTMYIVAATGDLEHLPTVRNQLTGVPSWVPDLRFAGQRATSPLTESFASFSADGTRLFARGVVLGAVDVVFRAAEEKPADYEAALGILERVRETVFARACGVRGCGMGEVWGLVGADRVLGTVCEEFAAFEALMEPGEEEEGEEERRWACRAFAERFVQGQFFMTGDGIMGIDERYADPVLDVMPEGVNDVLCVLKGAASPFRLRPVPGGYSLVGSCDVWGEGGVFDEAYFSARTVQDFVLL
ncbi:heterokaryon incompatibility protein-domain-containing protein [Lasiosphaeria hispida]|uniref:Heterokaryon incompatibility protein-domain-containing protein n=1 Tax=Lasiosphaeria hispida TaxID=260671 RepID=A0AAJ0HLA1_9PEZI|nr:heterokaryon incompatibility protein-domain-containing protein [Lasiosphaeria hispida]